MKDLLGTERFGFERILIQLLIPGLVALAPYLWLFHLSYRYQQGSDIGAFIHGNKELTLFLVFVGAIVVGLVIEDLGSRYERIIVDGHLTNCDMNFDVIWDAYLRTKENTQAPLAILSGYYSSVVVRMKFERSLAVGLLASYLGVVLLETLRPGYFSLAVLGCLLIGLVFGIAYLLQETYDTCVLLHENRILILQASDVLPLDYMDPGEPETMAGNHVRRTFKDEDGFWWKQTKDICLQDLGAHKETGYRLLRKVHVADVDSEGKLVAGKDPWGYDRVWVHGSLLGPATSVSGGK